MLEKYADGYSAYQDLFAIADARTAEDGTLSMQWYHENEGYHFPGYGLLPPKPDSWHDFRIDFREIPSLIAALLYIEPDVIYPTYLGQKERFTDERGVFSVTRADLWICRKRSDTPPKE
jgi:hypothetical protein